MENKEMYGVGVDIELYELLNSGKVIPTETVTKLNECIENVQSYYVEDLSDEPEERIEHLSKYQEDIEEFGKNFGETLYDLTLSKEEYLFLKKLIFNDIEYTRQDLFIGLAVKEDFFNKKDIENSVSKTALLFETDEAFSIDINDVTRISHLMGLYTIKGVANKVSQLYASIFLKISDISRLCELYKTIGEQLRTKGDNWTRGIK